MRSSSTARTAAPTPTTAPIAWTAVAPRGGCSEQIVVSQDFVLKVPDDLDPAGAAPLLCAGITTWSPLRHWNVGPGAEVTT